jgi:hypothetical protein
MRDAFRSPQSTIWHDRGTLCWKYPQVKVQTAGTRERAAHVLWCFSMRIFQSQRSLGRLTSGNKDLDYPGLLVVRARDDQLRTASVPFECDTTRAHDTVRIKNALD